MMFTSANIIRNTSTFVNTQKQNCYNGFVEFKDWLTKRYVEWRGDAIGNERSLTEFSKMIGIDKSTLSLLMSGERMPSANTIKKIAVHYPEVYEVLGMPSHLSPLDELPPEMRDFIVQLSKEVAARITAIGIDISTPEGKRKMMEEFSKSFNERIAAGL